MCQKYHDVLNWVGLLQSNFQHVIPKVSIKKN